MSRQKTNQSFIRNNHARTYKVLVIGASAGGPAALQEVIPNLPENYNTPILIVQHMPAAFTSQFAARLNSISQINVKEAQNGEIIQPKTAYIAPGGKQMLVEKSGIQKKIKITSGDASLSYKPSVDITFNSISQAYGSRVLAIVLTGMGADGREGARLLKSVGARVWTQDKESSVVYGMPKAVMDAGFSSKSLALKKITSAILLDSN
ncbi:MAG: hypothetical protein HAW66_07710 [Shewanella sp.]|nr:hypothetical protein [Shewanella sp.]